jgi:hypothetical protein
MEASEQKYAAILEFTVTVKNMCFIPVFTLRTKVNEENPYV